MWGELFSFALVRDMNFVSLKPTRKCLISRKGFCDYNYNNDYTHRTLYTLHFTCMLQGNIVTLHQNLSGVREDALNLADVGVAVFVNHDDFLLLCLVPDHPHLPADHEDHHAEIENNQPLQIT